MFYRKQSFVLLALFWGLSLLPPVAFADLEGYVRKPEPEFAWKLKQKIEQSGDRIYDLHFASQTWQGITWEHQLQVYQPAKAAPNATMLLLVTGGSATPGTISFGLELAKKIGAPVAFLYHIPNQPLLDDQLFEDDLIAETFVRYLKTKDENWPLLFPMVKSVVKAMDVVQAFGKEERRAPAERFIITGASKRGWTTWLAAAIDKRVRAIAPMVIDTLNMRAQMPKQIETFGEYSARLMPYVKRGLLPIPDTPEAQRLVNMVDPWSYRNGFTLPKLIVNGSNDFYWVTNALNLYWNELPSNKWALYVPNTGHDLLRQNSDRFNHVLNGLAAFSRHQMNGRAMPALTWKHESANAKLRLTIEAKPAPLGGRLWVADAPTQDFRTAKWNEQTVALSNGTMVGEVTPPEKGYRAFFGEIDYEIDRLKYHLSTQIQITGKPEAKTK